MKTILIIEDEPDLQKILSNALQAKGHSVIQALDGEMGWQLCKTEKPDLILLDLILPKKDGFNILAELKKDLETKKIPVIILTNLEGASDVEKALELGATTFLVKTNYSLEEVIEKIEKTLKG